MARRAVVLGSNGPNSAEALRFANLDADQIARVLSHPRCGFDVQRPPNTHNPQEIDRFLAHSAELCSGSDTFLVYFSGHGFVEGAALHLMLDETDRRKLLTTVLHADSIVRALRYCQAKHKILILDCCHAGAVFGDGRFKGGSGSKVDTLVSDKGPDAESFVAVMASDRLETAREFDSIGGSFLTKAISYALGQSFRDADFDRDGAIDLGDLKRWLITSAEHHNNKSGNYRVPVPFVFGRERGRIYLTIEPNQGRSLLRPGPNDHSFALLPLMGSYGVCSIGIAPVTNAQYRRFVDATGYAEPIGKRYVGSGGDAGWQGPFRPWDDETFGDPDRPVVCVSWGDARQYAAWLRNQDRWQTIDLVRASVWDFAAFGSYSAFPDQRSWLDQLGHDRLYAPARVTAASQKNRFGVSDLFGNVWQWTRTEMDEGRDRRAFLTFVPSQAWMQRNQQLRGGSFLDDLNKVEPRIIAGALEDGLDTRHFDLGFRISLDIPLSDLSSDENEIMNLAHVEPGEPWPTVARSA
jgi:hypothetical protein